MNASCLSGYARARWLHAILPCRTHASSSDSSVGQHDNSFCTSKTGKLERNPDLACALKDAGLAGGEVP